MASDNYAYIASEIDDPSKDEAAVRSYAKVFWKRYKELEGNVLLLALVQLMHVLRRLGTYHGTTRGR